MDEYTFGFERHRVVAFLDKQHLDQAIKEGRMIDPLTSDEAREIMIKQIKDVGKSENGEYGEYVNGFVDRLNDMSVNEVFSRYADIVLEWIP